MKTVREILAEIKHGWLVINESTSRHTDRNLFSGVSTDDEALLNREVDYHYDYSICVGGKSVVALFVCVK